MKEFINKLVEGIQESFCDGCIKCKVNQCDGVDKEECSWMVRIKDTVNQLAEEYKPCHKPCTDCEEYDLVRNHCPKLCKVIKETVKEMEENHSGWISVSEPPKKDGFYVVTFDGELCGENSPFVGMCEFEGGEWTEDCVLAWKQQTPYQLKGE